MTMYIPPTSRTKNVRDTPNFLYATLDATACAPFLEERRMRIGEPTRLHRKSGIWGTHLFLAVGLSALRIGPGLTSVMLGDQKCLVVDTEKSRFGTVVVPIRASLIGIRLKL